MKTYLQPETSAKRDSTIKQINKLCTKILNDGTKVKKKTMVIRRNILRWTLTHCFVFKQIKPA